MATTYALLGVTGSVGSAVLRCLLEEPPANIKLNMLVRNKRKLLNIFPDLMDTAPFPLSIVEGTPSDERLLQTCLADANAIFMCIAAGESLPGASLCTDTITSIINALEALQARKSALTKPTILLLRAVPVNEVLRAHMPWLVIQLLWFCEYYLYSDLTRASQVLEEVVSSKPNLLDYVLVDEGALHDPQGTKRTGHELVVNGPLAPALSFADLGGGFCELVRRKDEFRNMAVGVSATGDVKTTWHINRKALLAGAGMRIFGPVWYRA